MSKSAQESDIGILLRSEDPKENVVALSGLISALSRGCDISEYLPYVIQKITSPDIDTARAVYTILAHTSSNHQSEALMCVNELQKAASSSSNELVRAMALRTLSNVRVYDIFEVAKMTIQAGTNDKSPFVRKIALYAIMKLHAILFDSNFTEVEALFNAYDKRICEINTERIYAYVQAERKKRINEIYNSMPNSREIIEEAKKLGEASSNGQDLPANIYPSDKNNEENDEIPPINLNDDVTIPEDDIFYTQIAKLCPNIDSYSILQHHIDLTSYVKQLLKDPVVPIFGAAVSTLNAIAPYRLDLVHQVYKNLCCLTADVDEWCQADCLSMLERYCRYCFKSSFFHPVLIVNVDAYNGNKNDKGDKTPEESEKNADTEKEKTAKKKISAATNSFKLNVDLISATNSAKVLLSSRNSSVVLAATSLIYHCYPVPEVYVMTSPFSEAEKAMLYDIHCDAPRRPKDTVYSEVVECMLAQTNETVHSVATALMRLSVQAPREEKFIVLRALYTVATTFPQLFFGVYADVPVTCSIAHVLQIIVSNTSPIACSSASPNLTGSATQNDSSMVSNFIVSPDILSSLQDLFIFTEDPLPVKSAKLEVLGNLTPLYRDSAVLVLRELEDYLSHTYYGINGSGEQIEFERHVVRTITRILIRAITCNKQLDSEITYTGKKLVYYSSIVNEKMKKLEEYEMEIEELKKEKYQLTHQMTESAKASAPQFVEKIAEIEKKTNELMVLDSDFDVKEFTPARTISEECEKSYYQLISYRRVLSFVISAYLRTLTNILVSKPVTSATVQEVCVQMPEILRLLYKSDKDSIDTAKESYMGLAEDAEWVSNYRLDGSLYAITTQEKQQLETYGVLPIKKDEIRIEASVEQNFNQEVLHSRRIFPSTLNLPSYLDPLKVYSVKMTEYSENGDPIEKEMPIHTPFLSETTVIPFTKIQRVISSILIKLIHIGDKFTAPQVSQDDIAAVESTPTGAIYKPEEGNDYYFDPIKKELVNTSKFCSSSSSQASYGVGTVTQLSVAARVAINNILSDKSYINLCSSHIVEYLRRRISRIVDEPAPVKASILRLAYSVYKNRMVLKYGPVYQQQRRTLDDIDYVIAYSMADKAKNEYLNTNSGEIPQGIAVFSKIQSVMQSRIQKITERYTVQGTMEIIPKEATELIARNVNQAIEMMYKYVLDVLLQDEAFEIRDLANFYLLSQKDEVEMNLKNEENEENDDIKDKKKIEKMKREEKIRKFSEDSVYDYVKTLQIYQSVGESAMAEYYYKQCSDDQPQYSLVISRFVERAKINDKHVYQPLNSVLLPHEMSISSISHALATEIPKFVSLEPWNGDSPNDLRKTAIDIDASIARKRNVIIKEIETARSKIEAHKVKKSLESAESIVDPSKQKQLFSSLRTAVLKPQVSQPAEQIPKTQKLNIMSGISEEPRPQQAENLENQPAEAETVSDDIFGGLGRNNIMSKPATRPTITPQVAKRPGLVIKPLLMKPSPAVIAAKPAVLAKPAVVETVTKQPDVTPAPEVVAVSSVQHTVKEEENDNEDQYSYYSYDEEEKIEDQYDDEDDAVIQEPVSLAITENSSSKVADSEVSGGIFGFNAPIKEVDAQKQEPVLASAPVTADVDDDILSMFN